ncbi:MAG: FAD-binding oxidoreductase [Nevskiales bacterium]
MAIQGTRNPTGWGYLEQALTNKERKRLMGTIGSVFSSQRLEEKSPPAVEAIELPRCRLELPARFAGWRTEEFPPVLTKAPGAVQSWITTSLRERVLHALGRSFRDLAQLRTRKLPVAPDAVARPASLEDLEIVLEWANAEGYAVIPFGGGSSVVGGVTPEGTEGYPACISLDLQSLNRVLEINPRDHIVHAEAGILGPDLDDMLREQGLTVRHYPQSYYHSTLGGWVATRGAGHFSTLHAKIEDRVQALSVLLPDGRRAQTRALPASSIGPDPNRLWCGSEGALGIITDVRLRVLPVPQHTATAGVIFKTFEQALEAAREILQSGLWPAQLRLLDPFEHMMSSLLAGRPASGALMILGFESAAREVTAPLQAAIAIAQSHGGQPRESGKEGATQAWREAFFRQPYIRDTLLDYGIIGETFETAVPWSRLPDFYRNVRQATLDAVMKTCGAGGVNCRTTHAYPDGISLYFSFFAHGRHGALVEQWAEIKTAATDAVMANGGTASHHHAMGRDHKRWAKLEIPAEFRAAIRGAKRELDPKGILNPGLWFED